MTLLSTPLSLLVHTILKHPPPTNAPSLLSQVLSAMSLQVSPFTLGKYLFKHQADADLIEQILAAHQPKEQKGHSRRRSSLSSLPPLDSMLLKSDILRDMLEQEVDLSGTSNKWEVVKGLRDSILKRIQALEGPCTLMEEFQKMTIPPPLEKVTLSIQYLNTTSEEDPAIVLPRVRLSPKNVSGKGILTQHIDSLDNTSTVISS